MLPPKQEGSEVPTALTVLLTGASGYAGGRLTSMLEQQSLLLRCLARNPDKLRPLVKGTTEVVRGDVLEAPSLDEAMKGVHTAYWHDDLAQSGRRRDFVCRQLRIGGENRDDVDRGRQRLSAR